jgi:carboxypeptidase PM20D1
VPVEAGTEPAWSHPPFGGVIDGGYVWGRGTLDDKGSALAVLEAVEYLLAAGVQPAQTVYLAFGHDEEVNGEHGAAVLAARLRERGVNAEFVLDEGGWLVDGMIPGIAAPVASVCVGEKGYASIELIAKAQGGHSSMPPAQTSVGVLSAAITRLEARQMPTDLSAAIDESFAFLGPEMGFGPRLVFANLWLFGPLVERAMARSPQANAAMRTTTAATMFDAGVKENVLPASARAVVNFRILPGDTVQGVVEHVRRTIDDPSIAIRVLDGSTEPSPLSDPEAPAFSRLARAIRATFPGTLVTPFVSLGATDARHYTAVSPNVYRFVPARLRADDLARIHGTDERIAVDDYAGMIRFYIELLRSAGSLSGQAGGAVTRDFTHGDCTADVGCDPG